MSEKKKMPECPECEKMAKISEMSQQLGEIIEWSLGKSYLKRGKNYRDIQSLLADFYEIDLNKIEQERQALLAAIRENNA
jgi:hypothetical protein